MFYNVLKCFTRQHQRINRAHPDRTAEEMFQHLPVGDFKWVSERDLQTLDVMVVDDIATSILREYCGWSEPAITCKECRRQFYGEDCFKSNELSFRRLNKLKA